MGITRVEVSGRLALACGGCGEIILFLGREVDWYESGADGRPRSFVCELRVRRVRHAPYARRPRGRSRRPILSLTAVSGTSSAPRNTVMFRASKHTMRYCSPEVGF